MTHFRKFVLATGLLAAGAFATPAFADDLSDLLSTTGPVTAPGGGSGYVNNAPLISSPSSGADPITGTLVGLGVPDPATLPLFAGVVIGGATGALQSPTPLQSTLKYSQFRVDDAGQRVQGIAGGLVPN